MRPRLLIILAILVIPISFIFYGLSYLSSQTNHSLDYFPKLIINSLTNPISSPDFNFLILGLDPRHDQLEDTVTTDTIIIGRLTPSMHLNLVSIPRDLWSYYLDAKVNEIYPTSLLMPDKYQFISQEFKSVTGQAIDRTVIFTTDSLIKLIDLVGGVDVNLAESFRDDQYPNPDYINNPSTKISPYISIYFPSGNIHLDTSNITPFIRSRKSLTGGTDLGRINRQQLVIDALISKISSRQFITQPKNLVKLYNFWQSSTITNISDQDIFGLILYFSKKINQIAISKSVVPTSEYPQKNIIYHPADFQNAQWVFIPLEADYKSLHQYIKTQLFL